MIYYDVTLTIGEELLVFPGDPKVKIEEPMSISKGDVANVSLISFGSHTGTHIDAPKHFYDKGKTIHEIDMNRLIGPAKVFEIMDKNFIGIEDIKNLNINKGDRILFKTKNSEYLKEKEFNINFVYLSGEAAKYLADKEILTIGIDYFSVDKFGSAEFPAHFFLLGKDILIIEGLQLSEVKAGEYFMTALPLKLKDGNGSPARVVLMSKTNIFDAF
ncbi:MAG: cyclase family protein [Clostridiaceae bacterium]|nr:cyclase family protein [Clostridiaceae bacterium]